MGGGFYHGSRERKRAGEKGIGAGSGSSEEKDGRGAAGGTRGTGALERKELVGKERCGREWLFSNFCALGFLFVE